MAVYKINERKSLRPLTEATDPQDYRVVTVSMDVAMPANKRLEDYGVGGGSPSDPNSLFKRLSGTLESVGLEMASRKIDILDDSEKLTDQYKRRGEKFFYY